MSHLSLNRAPPFSCLQMLTTFKESLQFSGEQFFPAVIHLLMAEFFTQNKMSAYRYPMINELDML